MRNHRYVHGRGKDLEGGALAMDIQGIREGALFAMQDMQDVWSVRFTCLLVCRSAIFIDSKGDGNRAAPWQKGLQDEERQGA